MKRPWAKSALLGSWTALIATTCSAPPPVGGGESTGGGTTTPIELPSGTAGNSGSGSGSGNAPSPDANCGVQTHNLNRQPGDVLLVLDTSSSMIEEKMRATGNTRWADITAALDDVLPATDPSVNWGLMQFPGQGGRCTAGAVDVAVTPGSAHAVIERYRANPPPERVNYTPTRTSILAAADWLLASPSPNPKYIVLATDGEPNCRGDSDNTTNDPKAADALASAATGGVPVFVIGIATATVAVRTLDAMAVAGGRPRSDSSPKYYPADSGAEFVTAMAAISGKVASCVFSMGVAPPVPDNVLVEFSDGSHAVRDVTRNNGWDYLNGAYTAIELFGPPCEKVMAKASSDVKILFGCPDTQLIP